MPKLFIPDIGTNLVLTKNWKFPVHREYRNEKFLAYLGQPLYGRASFSSNEYENTSVRNTLKTTEAILPKGTVLKVDRVYIRKGAKDFSSVTFYATIPSLKKKYRFWAKLKDVNNLHYKIEGEKK